MSLSLILIFIIPFVLFPAIILPTNKLKMYSLVTILPLIIFIVLLLLELIFPSIHIYEAFGYIFFPVFNVIFVGFKEYSLSETIYLSSTIFTFIIYLIFLLFSYIIINHNFTGSNATRHKKRDYIAKIIYSIFFFLLVYFLIFYFLSSIRSLIPLEEGFFSPLFSLIHPLGEAI